MSKYSKNNADGNQKSHNIEGNEITLDEVYGDDMSDEEFGEE